MLFDSVSASVLRSAIRKFSLLATAAVTLLLPAAVSAQQTFSGGGAITVDSTQTTPSSSTLTISGATGDSIASLKIVLNGVTSDGESCGTCWSLLVAEFYLQAPNGGPTLELLGDVGDGTDGDDTQDAGSGLKNATITIQDGATPAPNGLPISPQGGSFTYEPSAYFEGNGQTTPLGTAIDWPQSDGSATLNGRFGGTGINNGDKWTLTVVNLDGYTTPITVSSWEMIVTYATTTPTSTSVSSNLNPAFTSNSVTLTATISPSSGPTGTVAFTDNGTTIAGCGAATVSGGEATCDTTMPQGYNNIDAVYSGGGGYGQSSGSLTQLVEVQPAQSGNTWCNNTSFSAPLNGTPIAYPAMIPVSGYSPGTTVGNVTLELEDVTEGAAGAGIEAEFLLVAPGGSNNLDFLDSAFNTEASGAVNLYISDAATLSPNYGTPTNNDTYLPFDGNVEPFDTFPPSNSPIVDSNIPSVPSTINYAAPYGKTNALTLQQAFSGAPANGDWALYATASNGSDALTVGGWCISLDVNSGVGTTTALTSSAQKAALNSSVTFTATVTVNGGSTPVTSGTVEFKDETTGAVLNSAATLNGSGVAAVTTSALAEGDHKILATYSGTSTYNTSFANIYQRIDHTTGVTALGGNSWQFCNAGAITIAEGSSGAETPNPSNIFVSNLPGTVNTATLTLENFSILVGDQLDNTESLVVGPTGAALDFFSNTAAGTIEDEASTGNYTFADSAGSLVPSGSGNLTPGTYKPTSYVGTENANDVFTADFGGFYTLPATFGYSATRGTSAFANEFDGTNPVGTWSLYFNSPNANANGTGAAGGWCMNFTENPVTVAVDLSHQGDGIGTDFVQGETGAEITTLVTAASNTGPTGDPLGTNPLTVTDNNLNSALTYTGYSGSGWTCTAPPATSISCTNDSAVAQGASYPTLILNVNVASNAPATISNSVSVSGAGITNNSGSDTITVDPTPVLSVAKSHTGNFVAGTTGQWTITVSNTVTGSATSGTVNVADTLPTNYTLNSYTSTSSLWTCGTIGSGSVSCTATPGITGGSSSTITLTVNVPAGSPSSVSNTAFAWGGGDTVHSQSSPAASNTDTVTVNSAPSITSDNADSFTVGAAGTFTVTTSGSPAPSLTFAGTLPGGVTFVDNGDGTATIMGTATLAGSYPITITAQNGIGSNATQSFTLTVNPPTTYVVTTNGDDATGTPSNCPIPSSGNTCTLRDALAASALSGAGSITFDPTAFATAQTITVTNNTLTIPSLTTITGPTTGSGASLKNLVTVAGGGTSSNYPVLATASSGINTAIQNLIVTNGNQGGISNGYAAALTIQNSTISGNNSPAGTGGVFNDYNASLTIFGSTISGNTGAYGAIVNESGGTVTVNESTISGNSAINNGGGGILSGGTSVTVTNSTISGNSAYSGGGIQISGGTLTLTNTIVAGNTASAFDSDINGAATDGGYNIIGDGTGESGISNGANGDQVGTTASPVNPQLAALGNYGGPTQTMIPLPGSVAICASSSSLIPVGVTTDQRGEPWQPAGGYCSSSGVDTGSVQSNYAISFTTQPPASAVGGLAISPAPVVSLSESGSAFTGANTGTVKMTDSASLLGGTTSEGLSSGAASFNNLVISGATSNDILTAMLTLNGAIDVTTQATTGITVTSTLATLTPSSGLLPASQTFYWNNGTGPVDFDLWVGTLGPGSNNVYDSRETTATSATVSIPSNGVPIYVTLRQLINGTWQPSYYTFTEPGSPTPATLTPSSGLLSASQTFYWNNGAGPVDFDLWLGTTGVGSNDLADTRETRATSVTIAIPSHGGKIYATLRQLINWTWQPSYYTFTEPGSQIAATLTPGSGTLSTSQTFSWSNGAGVVDFDLLLGTTGVNSTDLYISHETTATTATVPIPANGVKVYATLKQLINGTWQPSYYTFTEPSSPPEATTKPSSGTP